MAGRILTIGDFLIPPQARAPDPIPGLTRRDMHDIVGTADVIFLTLDCLRYDVARRALCEGRTPPGSGATQADQFDLGGAAARKGSTMSHPFGRNLGRIVSTKWSFHTKGSMDSLTNCWLS
jgi:hypothetical protein